MIKKERYIAVIQDFSEMSDTRRTFDREGSRRLIEAETTEKALQRNDRQIQKQFTKSTTTIMKTTNVFKCSQSSDTSHNTFQRSFIRFTSVIISFSRFDQVI